MIFDLPVIQNEPIFSVLTISNSTEIAKLVLNNDISICLCMSFAMTSKVWKKRKNFKINRESGRFPKNGQKAEDLPLYWKTWQVCTATRVRDSAVQSIKTQDVLRQPNSATVQFQHGGSFSWLTG